jgi:hypothetical protein
MMARLQLLEIHEQPWCPAAVRDGATDCLNIIAIWGRQYKYIVPKLRHAIEQSQTRRVVDLCSGGGGPWLQLYRYFDQKSTQPLEILLTDLYPNLLGMRAAAQRSYGQIHFVETPVDATQLGPELDGFRTLFTSFHHFPPHVARAMLHDAVRQAQGIGIFEQTRRSPLALVVMLFLPLIALLVVPFIRPFRPSRLFWTYLLPAIPLVLCIDGIISCLRTYSEREMAEMIAELHGVPYIWEIGSVPSPLSPIGILYAIGYPDVRASDMESAATAPRVDVMK